HAAPLLEKENNFLSFACPINILHPFRLHVACPAATLATNDCPVDAGHVEWPEVLQQGLYRKEPDCGRCALQMRNARKAVFLILDTHAPPDMAAVGGEAQAC